MVVLWSTLTQLLPPTRPSVKTVVLECIDEWKLKKQLVEVLHHDASSIPIPESQSVSPSVSPPGSPLSLPYSPQSPRVEADHNEQLEEILIASDSD